MEPNIDRRRIEAEEIAVLDIQFAILDLLREKQISKDELARRLNVTKSRVSQLFSAGANPTVKQVAKIFDALDCKFVPDSCHVGETRRSLQNAWAHADIFRMRESLRNVRPYEREEAANENWAYTLLHQVAA